MYSVQKGHMHLHSVRWSGQHLAKGGTAAYTSNAVCLHCAFFASDQLLPVNTSSLPHQGNDIGNCKCALYLVSVLVHLE